MGSRSRRPHAVLLPLPGQSHVNPMLQVAKLLHSRGFYVTFIHTRSSHQSILRSDGPDALAGSEDFRYEVIPDGVVLPVTSSQQVAKGCIAYAPTCSAPLREILVRLLNGDGDQPRVTCVVFNWLMSFALDVAQELSIPALAFCDMSAAGFLGFYHLRDLILKGYTPLKVSLCQEMEPNLVEMNFIVIVKLMKLMGMNLVVIKEALLIDSMIISISLSNSTPKVIIFDEYGRPVDIESEKFATDVGKITMPHCPPAIDSWKKVPQSMKEYIWRGVNNKYVIPEIYKAKVLEKANISWKNWKSNLRKKCDMHPTVAERKRNRPINIVKKEDWEDFVDFCSTPEDKIRREVGKEARKKVKVLHTTGRTGCARVAHKLKKESPTGEVNRSVLYVATHMPKNSNSSTSSNDYVEKIRKLVEDDPYLGQNDLDNDLVAMVLGRDRKGYVRGMGGGVSKTELRASAASREIARQLKNKNETMETDLNTLKEEMATIKEMIKSNPPRKAHQSSSSVHGTSKVPEQSNLPKTCFLKDFKRKHVAFGRLNSNTPPKEDVYNIIVDEIFDRNAYLFEGDGKFEDIMLGDLINWPKESVQFIRI